MTYQEFIEFNRNKDQGQFTHIHHIVPKCVGGTDDEENLIELSWLTHYYAHYLLAKENPDNKKIVNDWKHKGSIESWLKRCWFWKQRTNHSEETRKKISAALTGRKLPEERVKKAALGHVGLKRSDDTKRLMSEALKGNHNTVGKKWFNNGTINTRAYECPEGFVPGRLLSEEARAKMYNDDVRKKIGKANSGTNNGMYGKNSWNLGKKYKFVDGGMIFE